MRAPRLPGRRREESGAAALLVALLTIVLVGCLAFVADLGMAYANQRRLQNAVDASVLAVGQRIAVQADHTSSCSTVATTFDSASTRTYASSYLTRSAPPGSALAAGATGFAVTCPTLHGVPTLVVSLAARDTSPTFFGGMFGRHGVDLTKQARVVVGPLGTVVGLRPFAICQAAADAMAAAGPGSVYTYSFDNADTGCGYAPGNWGVMDFDGGSNPTGDTVNWIEHGYSGPISVTPPVEISGDPGAPSPGAVEDAMNQMMTLGAVTLPVFDNVTHQGGGSLFRITGFISVTPCSWKFQNKQGSNPACATPVSPVPTNYLQVKFSNFIPVGSLNLACGWNDPACDTGPRGYALAD